MIANIRKLIQNMKGKRKQTKESSADLSMFNMKKECKLLDYTFVCIIKKSSRCQNIMQIHDKIQTKTGTTLFKLLFTNDLHETY